MFRKIVILAGVFVALLAAPAAAQYSPPLNAPGTVVAGGTFTVSGQGAQPGATVTFILTRTATTTSFKTKSSVQARFVLVSARMTTAGQQLASTTADSGGRFSAQITIPQSTAPGNYALTAESGGVVLGTTSIQIVAANAGGSGGSGTGSGTGGTGTASALPRTGTSSLQPLTIVGAFFVAGGGLLILATRKRRHSTTSVA